MHIRHRHLVRPAAGSRGFTLVEILTATAIMALLVSLVMTVLSQVVTAWNRSSDELDIGGKARTALNMLASDLQQAVFRQDGNQWLSCTLEDTPNSPVPGVINTRLIFFTTTHVHQSRDESATGENANQIYGDVCAVEYRVTYADPFGSVTSTDKTFSLHRVTLDPATTFFGVNSKPVMGVSASSAGKPTLEENMDSLVDSTDQAVPNTTPGPHGTTLRMKLYGSLAHQSILLDNVARFKVFLYYYATNPNPPPAAQVYPQNQPKNVISGKYYYGGAKFQNGILVGSSEGFLDLISPIYGNASSPTFRKMAYADITMTVLKDDGVTLLNQFNGSMPTSMTWEDFLNRYGVTYTERIQFFNAPL